MVREQLNTPVSRVLIADADPNVGEREMFEEETLGDSTMAIIVEKEEHKVGPASEAEGAAFKSSIFKTAPLPPTSWTT
eukprot:2702166-Amphidinium_carterae.1